MECLCARKRISIPKKTYFTRFFPKYALAGKDRNADSVKQIPPFAFFPLCGIFTSGERLFAHLSYCFFPKRKITSGYLYQTRKKTRTFAKQPCEEYGNLCNSNPVSFTIHSQFLKTLSGAIQCNLFLFIFADKITIHNSSS